MDSVHERWPHQSLQMRYFHKLQPCFQYHMNHYYKHFQPQHYLQQLPLHAWAIDKLHGIVLLLDYYEKTVHRVKSFDYSCSQIQMTQIGQASMA